MLEETSDQAAHPALTGINTAKGDGVFGKGRRGVVGESPDFQGVFGHSGTNAGVVAESDLFHALFAISHSSNNAGVAGFNDSGPDHGEGGTGVFGKGRVGVHGESTDFQGVFGHSVKNAGVVGEASEFHGVFGVSHSPHNAGVFATNDTEGFGVIATCDKGIGIVAKGGKLAGRFEGIVEITGGLLVTGINVAARIMALEQEVGGLKERLRLLEAQAGAGHNNPPVTTAVIAVELRLTPGAFNQLVVTGSGFNGNETVSLSLVSETKTPGGVTGGGTSSGQATADNTGRFSQVVSVTCEAGSVTTHSVSARGLSSGRLSNTAAASC